MLWTDIDYRFVSSLPIMVPGNELFHESRSFSPQSSNLQAIYSSRTSPSTSESPTYGRSYIDQDDSFNAHSPYHQEHPGYISESLLLSEDRKAFKCPQCRYFTDRKNNLKRHVVTMHQECTKTLECCGVVFQSKSSLRDHVGLFHRGGYRCQICSRNFCRKALLRRHLTVHSGRKDFSCDLCGYATSHKSNLERHQKVHNRKSNHQQTDQHIFESSSLYNEMVVAHAQSVLLAQTSRLLPAYRMFPDRLKQTHVLGELYDKLSATAAHCLSELSDDEHHTKIHENNSNDPNVNTNSAHLIKHSEHKMLIDQFPTDNTTEVEAANMLREHKELSPERDNAMDLNKSKSCKPLKNTTNATASEKVRPYLKTSRRRKQMIQTTYGCQSCTQEFRTQIQLSTHKCSLEDSPLKGAWDCNVSLITAVRKGQLKLTNFNFNT